MGKETIIGVSEAFSMQPVKSVVGGTIWGHPNEAPIERIEMESLQTASDRTTTVYVAYDKDGLRIAEWMCGSVNVYYK